jgi:hypothetical protein
MHVVGLGPSRGARRDAVAAVRGGALVTCRRWREAVVQVLGLLAACLVPGVILGADQVSC